MTTLQKISRLDEVYPIYETHLLNFFTISSMYNSTPSATKAAILKDIQRNGMTVADASKNITLTTKQYTIGLEQKVLVVVYHGLSTTKSNERTLN
jgi:hypothetical protein